MTNSITCDYTATTSLNNIYHAFAVEMTDMLLENLWESEDYGIEFDEVNMIDVGRFESSYFVTAQSMDICSEGRELYVIQVRTHESNRILDTKVTYNMKDCLDCILSCLRYNNSLDMLHADSFGELPF